MPRPHAGRPVPPCIALCLAALASCAAPPKQPAIVTFLDGGWTSNEYHDWGQQAIAQFTRETGIVVKRLPAPESANDQLSFARQLLEAQANTPDVYLMDAFWPAVLAEHLLDLNPDLAREASQHFPSVIAANTVKGRLVAMPYHADAGILFYRTDLLSRYGFRGPPATWEEMERMAAAVQAGERTRGRKGFWGFVWQGAAYEGLTCNALEWQMSEGGGAILEEDGTITVNNPHTVRAWARAARWVGSISPPGVVAYLEMDAHSLWESGNACFMRGWPSSYATSAAEGSAVKGRFDVVALPAGRAGRASAMGENALAVSRYSRWPREATALVRYLTRPDVQRWRARTTALWPTLPDLYEDPELLKTDPYYPRLKEVLSRYAAVRPATAAGKKYPDVSAAYARTVHSVLTGEKSAAAAAAALETELAGMGFRTRAADRSR